MCSTAPGHRPLRTGRQGMANDRGAGRRTLRPGGGPGLDPYEPYVVRPDQVRSERRGTGVWSREVHDIVGPDQPSGSLLVGETFSAEGVWSSYPPHKHDAHDPRARAISKKRSMCGSTHPRGSGSSSTIRPPRTLGRLRSYTTGTPSPSGRGYHSFVAAAGHRFYYLWALAGTERELHFRTDPRHTWLLDGAT